ncbi:MAG: hypothetical protein U0401_23190 [Anaerolineae bacterium]
MDMDTESNFTIGLAEIVLIVKDVPASARFYREVVGLTPESEPDDTWAWFWAGPVGQSQRVAVHKGSLLFEGQSPLPAGERWGADPLCLHRTARKAGSSGSPRPPAGGGGLRPRLFRLDESYSLLLL